MSKHSGDGLVDLASILHVDMDAFFVSAELVRRPELRGRPVVVGGKGARGVVAAASYEARAYGVFSAMPSGRAQRLCPQAVFLDGDYRYYQELSAQVMDIFQDVTPIVEPLSLDEAFLDVSGARRLLGDPLSIATLIRNRVAREVGLSCSVGIASSKFLAKLASEGAKPKATPTGPQYGDGILRVAPGQELSFLHPLPTRALWGVGPKTQVILDRLAIKTVGDLAVLPLDDLQTALGSASGLHLWRLANGIDDRPVQPHHQVKSVSHEETYAVDLHGRQAVTVELLRLADAVAARLRGQAMAGRTVTIKIRFNDFHTVTRSHTSSASIWTGRDLYQMSRELLKKIDIARGVRLVGVGVSNFSEQPSEQLQLGVNPQEQPVGTGWTEATAAMDAIRARFGDSAIVPAAIHGRGPKQRGDQQWGPTAVSSAEETA